MKNTLFITSLKKHFSKLIFLLYLFVSILLVLVLFLESQGYCLMYSYLLINRKVQKGRVKERLLRLNAVSVETHLPADAYQANTLPRAADP